MRFSVQEQALGGPASPPGIEGSVFTMAGRSSLACRSPGRVLAGAQACRSPGSVGSILRRCRAFGLPEQAPPAPLAFEGVGTPRTSRVRVRARENEQPASGSDGADQQQYLSCSLPSSGSRDRRTARGVGTLREGGERRVTRAPLCPCVADSAGSVRSTRRPSPDRAVVTGRAACRTRCGAVAKASTGSCGCCAPRRVRAAVPCRPR
jgi:hypothetical protein